MKAHHEIIIEQFTRQAIPFSKLYAHNNSESLNLLIEKAKVSYEDRVLDVACGSGIVACAFAEIAEWAMGIDLVPAMLEQAKILAAQKKLRNLSWQQGDIETLPFPDRSFSIAVSRYAFHHFLRPERVLSEMIRVCRPGGRIAIADVTLPADKVKAYDRLEKLRDPSHTRALTLEAIEQLVTGTELQNLTLTFYKVKLELEQQLAASFPAPGDRDKIRQIVRDDIGRNRLGIDARWQGERICYTVPISILVGEKTVSQSS